MMKNEAIEIVGTLTKKHGVSFEKLAARFGVVAKTIERWSKGETNPNLVELEKLRQILNGYESRKE